MVLDGTICRCAGRCLGACCCPPAPHPLTAHCVAARIIGPVPAITIITTVTEAVGTVLSELLVDLETDFLYDVVLRHGQPQRSLRLCSRIGGGMAAKAAKQRGGLGQGARLADAGAGGRLRRVFSRRNDALCDCCVQCACAGKCACSQCAVRLYAWPMACSGRVWDVLNGVSHDGDRYSRESNVRYDRERS